MTAVAEAALREIASYGFDTTAVPIEAPLDDDSWDALLHGVRRERLMTVLEAAAAAGHVAMTPPQQRCVEAEAAQAVLAVSRLEDELAAVSQWLGAAGIDFRVLKGAAVAHLDHAPSRLRSYADIDLLIRSEQIDGALALLADQRYARDLPERRPHYDRRFAKEVPLADGGGREIDVHRTLALGMFGAAMDLERLWERSATFEVRGVTARALDAEGRFVHACFNAVLGDASPRLVALRDVAQIAHRHALDPGRLRTLAPSGRGAAVVAAAVLLVRERLGVSLEVEVEAIPPTARERLALRCYRSRGGSNTLEILSTALGLPVPQAIEFLAETIVPGPAYRRARRDAGRPREWATAMRELVRRRATPSLPDDDLAVPVERARRLPARRPDLAVVELEGQCVVWDPATGGVARLDPIASMVWAHLDGESDVDALVDDLAIAFGADRDIVDVDVRRLLLRLEALALVVT